MERQPTGVTPRVSYFWAAPDLRVLSLRGDLGFDDCRALIAVLGAETSRGATRYASLVDVRRLSQLDGDALAVFLKFAAQVKAQLASLVIRSAIVHGGNLAAATVAGYTRLIGEPFPARAFAELDDALAWLGHDELLEEIAAVLASLETSQAPLARLRALLARSPRETLGSSARALGLSPRSLQRLLKGASTSLRGELARARIGIAKERLRNTDDKISTIATDVGFQRPQAFARAFRGVTGKLPSEWRSAARTAAASTQLGDRYES